MFACLSLSLFNLCLTWRGGGGGGGRVVVEGDFSLFNLFLTGGGGEMSVPFV